MKCADFQRLFLRAKEGPSETEVNIICGMKMEIDMKIQNETYLG